MEPREDEELKKVRVRASLPFLCLLNMSEVVLNHSPSKSWMISGMLAMSGGGNVKKEVVRRKIITNYLENNGFGWSSGILQWPGK